MGNEKSVPISPLSLATAAAVRVIMARRGLRQTDLVKLAGRSQAHWSKRLNGLVGFAVADVETLAAGFGLTTHQMMDLVLEELDRLE